MKDLIKKAQKGDVHAFEQLISEHQTTVYNIALKIMGNPHDAADAAQESLIKVFKNINKFSGNSKFSTWVYRITHNVCIDEFRKKKQQTYSIDEFYDDENNPALNIVDESPTPEQRLLNKEQALMLGKAIMQLPPVSRGAIYLRDIRDFSYEEISKIQKCSVGTVKSRISRARTQLKEIIMKQNY